MTEIEKIKKEIKKFKNFIITSHVNPEGDSIGSQLAMAGLLRGLGKNFVIANSDKIPEHYLFLPGADSIQNRIDKSKGFDAAIVLDCPNLKRTGRIRDTVRRAGRVINIDHHVGNERFGDANWVEKDASSVGEMVYGLYKAMNVRIAKEAALCLYISILTDTGSFNYDNTSSVTHGIISELMDYGIEPYEVSKSVYENKTLGSVKLLGRVLSGVRLAAKGKISYISARQSDLKKAGAKPSDCENFVGFARSVKGVSVALFFREDLKKKGVFHVSFRSKRSVDVNKLAAYFGGGGHPRASGCVLCGTLEAVQERVLRKVRNEL